jgi:hypothetical protein
MSGVSIGDVRKNIRAIKNKNRTNPAIIKENPHTLRIPFSDLSKLIPKSLFQLF